MFQTFFVQPLFNALILVYQNLPVHDFGIAVIILVVGIRILLWPLFERAVRSQVLVTKIQPAVQKIQKEHKDDPVRQSQELMALYRESGFNPFMSFFVVLIQLPILLALYRVFLNGIQGNGVDLLYPWVNRAYPFSTLFLSWIDLSKPFLGLTLLACAVQFGQSWQMVRKQAGSGPQAAASQAMAWISPLLTFILLFQLPSVVGLYWTATTVISIVQQYAVQRKFSLEEKK